MLKNWNETSAQVSVRHRRRGQGARSSHTGSIRATSDAAIGDEGQRKRAFGSFQFVKATLSLAWRMLRLSDLRLLIKFAYNFGFKGMLSVQRFKKRLKQGKVFPPFLFISVTNACNLRCQGCWVDVDKSRHVIEFDELDRLVTNAKAHGNSFFGILGGEPFLHPDLIKLLRKHPDCYFQIFTNGQMITDKVARALRRAGNATPLISVEGSATVSDERRGRTGVLDKTLRGIENCVKHRLITGVASSICQSNYEDLVRDEWIDRLIDLGVAYTWFHTYRPVGPVATPSLALRPEQVLDLRRFAMKVRNTKPIALVDAYWDDEGRALCPAATGVSHHIGPFGHVEPCPIVQFANETIRDNDGDIFKTMVDSPLLKDFRSTAAQATRGCIVLERPDLLREVVSRHGAEDTTLRKTAMLELASMRSRPSQHNPGHEIPEENWLYRFAKRHWFFGFGAYS